MDKNMIKPSQINEYASIQTMSSFLRSSSIKYITWLSIKQIELLLEKLPVIYETPLIGDERLRKQMEYILNRCKRQFEEGWVKCEMKKQWIDKKAPESKIQTFSRWCQSTFLHWFGSSSASNQLTQSPEVEKILRQSHKNGIQQADGQNEKPSLFVSYSYIGSKLCEEEHNSQMI